VACAVVGITDHFVARSYALHVCADLFDDAGEVRTFAAGKGRREDVADQALADLRLADVDARGADRDKHLVGAGLRTRDVAHFKDLNAAVVVESNCLHNSVTFRSTAHRSTRGRTSNSAGQSRRRGGTS
jgi:hypothetical protein